MITQCTPKDFTEIYEIINDGAQAYGGVIPADFWPEPYMSKEELKNQIDEGVQFWSYSENEKIIGVMGIQFKNEAKNFLYFPIQKVITIKNERFKTRKTQLNITVT